MKISVVEYCMPFVIYIDPIYFDYRIQGKRPRENVDESH